MCVFDRDTRVQQQLLAACRAMASLTPSLPRRFAKPSSGTRALPVTKRNTAAYRTVQLLVSLQLQERSSITCIVAVGHAITDRIQLQAVRWFRAGCSCMWRRRIDL